MITVNRDALARLLQQADPGGFNSNALGVRWVDDGSGFARELVAADDLPDEPSILNGVVFDVIVTRLDRSDPDSKWAVEVRAGGEPVMRGSGVPYADGLRAAAGSMTTWVARHEVAPALPAKSKEME